MITSLKKRIVYGVAGVLATVVAISLILTYLLLAQVPVLLVHAPNSVDGQAASRKLKMLKTALAEKRLGFVRLTETEINSLLVDRSENEGKERAVHQVSLVKTRVLLNPPDISFVTWHKVTLYGIEFPVIWQRIITPERTEDGWRLSMEEMRLGKLAIPGRFWADVNRFLGNGDKEFAEQKVWLSSIPTVMLSRNEISRAPELRLYSYVPLVKQDPAPLDTSLKMDASTQSAWNPNF